MRRTIRFWWKKGVLYWRSNCGALLKRNFSGIAFLVDSTKEGNEEVSPFSADKRSPPLEEYKWKADWVFLLGMYTYRTINHFILVFEFD